MDAQRHWNGYYMGMFNKKCKQSKSKNLNRLKIAI